LFGGEPNVMKVFSLLSSSAVTGAPAAGGGVHRRQLGLYAKPVDGVVADDRTQRAWSVCLK
jgi:hypothetical protein